MTMKPSTNTWAQCQQCPCGDWKCYIKHDDGDDQTSLTSTLLNNEISSSTSCLGAAFTPYVGQIFQTDCEAFEYYSNFARKTGFSIRKARSTESQNLGVYRRDFVCYRSGFNQPRKKANVDHPRDRKSVRCGCDAKMYLTKEIIDGVAQWYASQFSNVHNHELLEDEQVRLLPAYRKIRGADQERILLLSKAGFTVNRIVKVLELEKGVQPGQLPYIEKDVRNYVRTCKKTEICFGCVLLHDENLNSYAWALQAFVRFMRGKHPQTIVTDIDLRLRDAIAEELPNTKHVISIWKVLSKLPSWFSLPLGSRYKDFKAGFDVLCHLEGLEDFEHHWNVLVAQYGLTSDKHIALLFSYRAYWACSYIKSYFLARTMTIEFSQSLNTFLKGILVGQTCLPLFFEQVSAAANLRNSNREVLQHNYIKTCMPIEEHARSILTPYVFNVLQHEIELSMQYSATEVANASYLVQHYKKMDREYYVFWVPEDEQIHCSCKEFQHSGILCRHIIRFLAVKNYFQIPQKYFLLRWRVESSLVPIEGQTSESQSRHDDCAHTFHVLAENILTESLISKDRFHYVTRELSGLLDHVRNMPVTNDYSPNLAATNIDGS
ncbi:hypothetical protein ACFE04_001538 [Oxalis oulophora]